MTETGEGSASGSVKNATICDCDKTRSQKPNKVKQPLETTCTGSHRVAQGRVETQQRSAANRNHRPRRHCPHPPPPEQGREGSPVRHRGPVGKGDLRKRRVRAVTTFKKRQTRPYRKHKTKRRAPSELTQDSSRSVGARSSSSDAPGTSRSLGAGSSLLSPSSSSDARGGGDGAGAGAIAMGFAGTTTVSWCAGRELRYILLVLLRRRDKHTKRRAPSALT